MIEERDILFSERFEAVYELLGLLGMVSAANHYKGIRECDIIDSRLRSCKETKEIIDLLKHEGLVVARGGQLLLNLPIFFSLTVWDLLAMVEPWITSSDELAGKSPPGDPGGLSELISFTRSRSLYKSYMNI